MKKIVIVSIVALVVIGGYLHFNKEKVVPNVADSNTIRYTEQGKIIGFLEDHNTHSWLGIPFAKPPVNELRWRAPKPPEVRQDLLKTLAYANVCPQVGIMIEPELSKKYHGDEDCLYLNIFAPRFSPDEIPKSDKKLAVMVWIHGGGNALGKPSWTSYAYKLAGDYNVVVVSISYRLGLLGWMYNDALFNDNDSPEDRSGNFGTLDTIAALQWVQNNIAHFGGDPNRVTIFGESAGGRNVFALMASPLAKGLFHRAIVQSGLLQWCTIAFAQNFNDSPEPGITLSSNEAILRLLQLQNDINTRDQAKDKFASMNKKQKRTLLRSAHAQELVMLYTNDEGQPVMTKTANIIRDGHVIPNQDPINVFADTSMYNSVPLITGSNKDEIKLFLFGEKKLVKKRFWLFPKVIDLDIFNKLSEYAAKNWARRSVDNIAGAITKSNQTTVYAYRFDWDELPQTWLVNYKDLFGASHAFEIPFAFHAMSKDDGLIPKTFTPENLNGRQQISDAMSSYWVQFAKTGNPEKGVKGELIEWQAWNPEKDGVKRIIFDTQDDGGIRMNTEIITKDSLKDALLNDKEIKSDELRCKIYYNNFITNFNGQILDKESYITFGDGMCKEYPQGKDNDSW